MKKLNYDAQLAVRMHSDTRKRLNQRAERENRTACQMARIILEKSLLKEKI